MKDMVKSVLLVAVIAFASAVRAESYLYWMVDTTGYEGSWDYAAIKVVNDGVNNRVGYLTMDGNNKFGKSTSGGIEGAWASLGSYEANTFSFIVELYSEANGWQAQTSSAIAYQALSEGGYLYNSMPSGGNKLVFGPGFTSSAPEPTSGVLMLIGVSVLALRRKSVKA